MGYGRGWLVTKNKQSIARHRDVRKFNVEWFGNSALDYLIYSNLSAQGAWYIAELDRSEKSVKYFIAKELRVVEHLIIMLLLRSYISF